MAKLNKTEMYAAEQDSPSLRMTAGVKHTVSIVQPFLQLISF